VPILPGMKMLFSGLKRAAPPGDIIYRRKRQWSEQDWPVGRKRSTCRAFGAARSTTVPRDFSLELTG
jgi:hypothetical protein